MHRTLRKLLPDAVGDSQFVITANVDIRGFSTYSLSRDSAETALYLKKVYVSVIDHFFQFGGVFHKPTGDGLVVVIPFTEAQFAEIAERAILDALKLGEDFKTLTTDEPMIRFRVPSDIGIGLSAGSASRLSARGKTLDYSGRVLNQASRLMDLARPRGLVFDESVGVTLPPKLVSTFEKDAVFLRGIADSEPITIYYRKELTQIDERYRQPQIAEVWETVEEERTLRQLKDRGRFRHKLKHMPTDRKRIKMEAVYPKYRSGKRVRGS